MRDRKGNWQDLLASHSLAVDTKKLWLGFVATLATVALLTIIGAVYTALVGVRVMPYFDLGARSFVSRLIAGDGAAAWWDILPLLNPFAGNVAHFALSIFLYMTLLAVWSYCGGAISRLTALQYGRDDIPTLNDGLKMVRDKRNAFFFAPLTPLLGVIIFSVCNMILGLICSIPYVGGWITGISIPFVALPAAIIATFIIVLGVVTFGLMFPAVSIGGKDAFEGWSSAYSYLLWGFNRFVGYTAVAAIVGLVTTLIAMGIAELFVGILAKSISIGLIGGSILQLPDGLGGMLEPSGAESVGISVASGVTLVIAIMARALVIAYAFSFFFTANTIICFLLRKHVDRIEIDEVYEETAEEDTFEDEFPETGSEEAPEEDVPEEEPEISETEVETAPEESETSEEESPEEEAALEEPETSEEESSEEEIAPEEPEESTEEQETGEDIPEQKEEDEEEDKL